MEDGSSSTLTQSSSPQSGSKQEHTTDNEDMDSGINAHISKTLKVGKKSTRPKAGDYHDSQKELILTAANIYRVLLASRGPFPNTATEVKLIKKAWKLMNDESGLKPRPLTPSIITIVSIALLFKIMLLTFFEIKARGSQLRSEAKTKTASLVEALYGFDSGRSKHTIAENRKIAEGLKEKKGFVYEVINNVIVWSANDIINSTFRCFLTSTASAKGYTTIQSSRRP